MTPRKQNAAPGGHGDGIPTGSGSGHGSLYEIVSPRADIPPELSDERDWWLRRLLAAERAAWLEGYEAGNRDGYLHGTRQMEAGWRRDVVPVIDRTIRHIYAMEDRWKLRGEERTRETFGQPHPGDRFPRGAA